MTTRTHQQITITIPATIDKAITPNGMPRTRGGIMKRDRLQKELKSTTMWAVKGHYLDVFPDAPWRLDYVVARAKGKQALDDDNIKASLKYVQDGIAAERGVNDRYIEVGRVRQIRDPLGAGYIEVTISSAEAPAETQEAEVTA